MRVSVTVRFVDGSVQDMTHGEDFPLRLHTLQAEGFEGKRLIHALLTDDWEPSPLGVDIQSDSLQLWIPYR